jgi:phenylalanyl-tRNA synthetase alpha chain
MSNVDAILESGLSALDAAGDLVDLEQIKARYLGKTGELTGLLKQLGKLPAEQCPPRCF